MTSKPRRRRRLWPWLLLAMLVGLWFAHEPALVWAARKAADTFLPRLGLRLEVGSMRLHLFHPIEFRDVRFRVTNPPASKTDATARRLRLSTTSPWEWFFGDGRVFRLLEVESLAGTFDFRREAIIPQPLPTLSRADQERLAQIELVFLPKEARFRSCGATFLADNQTYAVRELNATFSEAASGRFTVAEIAINAGSIDQVIRDARATTAWKEGALYLSDFALRDEVVIREFVANFVNVGGVSLDWDVGAYGGTLRGNIFFGSENDQLLLEASTVLVNLPVAPIPGLIALPARADGLIRDARLTFRGNPDRPLDNEISLRVAADDFRWNERGWQSLVLGANYIGRRVYLSTFDLTQADNRISANGEMAVPERAGEVPKSYVVNLSADVRDLAALAALAGPPFDQLGGQLYVHGALQGEGGRIGGYLDAQASGVTYRTLPPASARAYLVARNDELQIPYAELWAGKDRVEGRGSVGWRAPHRYAGELNARIEDLGVYTPFAGEAVAGSVFSGAATVEWQGDGTLTSHSGSIHARLIDVMTSVTPTGITGEFEGTYSPQNVYFSTARLTHGPLQLDSRVTVAASGLKVQDLTLRRQKLRLLTGEAFVPLNVFALAAGRTVAEALDETQPIYANFTSGDLPVADLVQMAGQNASVQGRVRLNLGASGPLGQLQLAGQLLGRGLAVRLQDIDVPPTTADITLGTKDGRATVSGTIRTAGFQPLTLSADMPFAYEEMPDGLVRLFRPDAPVSARLEFPGTSLEILRPFLPTARRLEGTLAGRFTLAGTLNAPQLDGEATLTDGDLEIATDVPRVNRLAARVRMNTSRVTLESLRGEVGAGPFEATGTVDLRDPANPAVDFRLTGSKVLLARDAGMRLRADLDLTARGQGNKGAITGSVSLVDGRIFRRLEVTPFLVPNPVAGPAFVAPGFAGLVPPPWGDWTLDVALRNAAPFLLVGNLANGEISPELAVKGTLGAPWAGGTVTLKNLQAYLPASTLLIPDGRIYFTRDAPFMPIMDVRARTDVSGYAVQIYAYGPLDQSKLVLRSDPPLSQENLVFLLTTGLTPAGMSGVGLGEAAAGQGGIILLRELARQLEPLGLDLNSFVNRLSVRVVPPSDPSQGSSLVSELRLTDRFSLSTGRDGYGFYNAGVRYTIRFQ